MLAGLTTHLSNLDIGAGTPGDSMVTQFPRYTTPLTHPYLPSAAIAAQALQTDPNDPRPINPAMFAASIDELRHAAAAIAPTGLHVRSKAERERDEKNRVRALREGDAGKMPSTVAKKDIEQYLSDSRKQDKGLLTLTNDNASTATAGNNASATTDPKRKPSSSSSSSSSTRNAAREKSRYESRVRALEEKLVHLHSDAERNAAKEAWTRAEEAYAVASQETRTAGHNKGSSKSSGGKRGSSGGNSAADALAALDPRDAMSFDALGAIPETDPVARKAAHIKELQRALASGEVVGKDFAENLDELRSQHRENLAAVEDLYYQQKLTAQLGNTVADNARQQVVMMGGEAAMLAAATAGTQSNAQRQHHLSPHQEHERKMWLQDREQARKHILEQSYWLQETRGQRILAKRAALNSRSNEAMRMRHAEIKERKLAETLLAEDRAEQVARMARIKENQREVLLQRIQADRDRVESLAQQSAVLAQQRLRLRDLAEKQQQHLLHQFDKLRAHPERLAQLDPNNVDVVRLGFLNQEDLGELLNFQDTPASPYSAAAGGASASRPRSTSSTPSNRQQQARNHAHSPHHANTQSARPSRSSAGGFDPAQTLTRPQYYDEYEQQQHAPLPRPQTTSSAGRGRPYAQSPMQGLQTH